MGYSPQDHRESDTTERLSTKACTVRSGVCSVIFIDYLPKISSSFLLCTRSSAPHLGAHRPGEDTDR